MLFYPLFIFLCYNASITYASGGASQTENVAIGNPIEQSSTEEDGPSFRVVDGHASGNYWDSIIKTSRNLAIGNGRVAGQEYLVVAGSSVMLQTSTLFIAKEYLKRYSGRTPSRMVTEVQNGIVKKDPHMIGGQDQGKGNAAGFNKYWNDWNDIRRMTAIAQAYADDTETKPRQECKCFANGSTNEKHCESGMVSITDCVRDTRCHWGPEEIESCRNMPIFIANYERMPKGCVIGQNIKLFKDKSVAECGYICDAIGNCVGFEYGVSYGGRGGYKSRDCQPQLSSNTAGCNGAHYNLDFYKREPHYQHMPKRCVHGQTIKLYKLYKDKSVAECADICDSIGNCAGFEYGVSYGGIGRSDPRDCQPQSSSYTGRCSGARYNLDFYKKIERE